MDKLADMHVPMMIPHSRPGFEPAFLDGLQRVLQSRQLTAAHEVGALEAEVAGRVQQSHAVAVDSGTSALMLAVRALKYECETGHDIFRVGIPAYACSAVLHAVRAAGATPVCMDCGADLRLDQAKALSLATHLEAVVLVHPFGFTEPLVLADWPCPVIEDIAQSAGSTLHARPAGSFGDMTIASFYATKPWGGACGGMVLSHDEHKMQLIRSMSQVDHAALDDAWLGYVGNHQMSDIHAALARTRLTMAKKEWGSRQRVAGLFDACLADSPWRAVARHEGDGGFRYIIRYPDTAEVAIQYFRSHNIYACRPVQRTLSGILADDSCFAAEAAWRDCVSIPLLSDCSDAEVEHICDALQSCPPQWNHH